MRNRSQAQKRSNWIRVLLTWFVRYIDTVSLPVARSQNLHGKTRASLNFLSERLSVDIEASMGDSMTVQVANFELSITRVVLKACHIRPKNLPRAAKPASRFHAVHINYEQWGVHEWHKCKKSEEGAWDPPLLRAMTIGGERNEKCEDYSESPDKNADSQGSWKQHSSRFGRGSFRP